MVSIGRLATVYSNKNSHLSFTTSDRIQKHWAL